MVNQVAPTPWKFIWQVIKPYRWWYVLMLQAPILMDWGPWTGVRSCLLLLKMKKKKARTDPSFCEILIVKESNQSNPDG